MRFVPQECERTTGVEYMGRMERRTRLAAMAIAGLFFATMFVGMATPVSAAEPAVWTQMPNMGTNRSQAAVVTGSDGLIYVMGGFTGTSSILVLDWANSYNPSTGAWRNLAAMPVGTRGAAAAADDNGKIYIFGGYNGTELATTQIYDIATNTWTTGADMPDVRWIPSGANVGSYIYVAGGVVGTTAFNTVWYYTPSANTWNVDSALPAPRMGGQLLAVGADLYYIGGLSGVLIAESDVYHFNIYSSAAWDSIASLPAARGAMAGTVGADGVMYVFVGGETWYNLDPGNVTGFYYNWATATWGNIPNLPVAVRYAGGTATSDGRIWCFGGSNLFTSFKSVFSMQVADYQLTMTPSSVGQGQSLMVTVTPFFAFTTPTAFMTYGYIVSPDGVVYATTSGSMGPYVYVPEGRPFAFTILVPQAAPVGTYTLFVTDLEFDTAVTDGYLDGKNVTFSVTSAPSMQDQLNALKDKQFDSTMGTLLLVLVVIAIVMMLVVMVLLLRKKP